MKRAMKNVQVDMEQIASETDIILLTQVSIRWRCLQNTLHRLLRHLLGRNSYG